MKLRVRSKAKLSLNIAAKATQSAEVAAKIVAAELNGAFQDALGAEVWPHKPEPGTGITIRSNGQAVGSPRNIVDTGILRASNTFNINGTLATFKWTVGYATAVHYGATIYPYGNKNARPVKIPPKPWTSAVLGTVSVSGITPFPYKSKFKDTFILVFKKGI
jgi:hypothetical protein